MRRPLAAAMLPVVFAAGLLLPAAIEARGSGGGRPFASHASSGLHRSHSSIRCESCPRDSHGRIQRSKEAVDKFKRTHPKPPDCDRCDVDHIILLSKGGKDDPSNMQWLPRE